MNKKSKGTILIYKTPTGSTEIEVDLHGETIWLSQKQISALFQKDSDTIGLHIKNIYQTGELQEKGTTEKNSVVQNEGKRSVKREIRFYNLDMIISIGYRVSSIQGTHFRIWATTQLKEYIIKGFVLDDARLKGTRSNYFDELYSRVRSIRASEKNLYTKVKDIFTLTSLDYESSSEIARTFLLLSKICFIMLYMVTQRLS
jgi:hypothetical protein